MIPHDQVGLGKHHVRNGQDRTMGTLSAVKKLAGRKVPYVVPKTGGGGSWNWGNDTT